MKLQDVILRGTRSGQPAANSVPVGSLYYVTDEYVIERSNGTTWDQYSPRGSSGGSGSQIILTDDFADADPILYPPGGASGINQLTGDVTAGPGVGSVAATIANSAVTYAKMQNVSAASKLLGRGDSGSGAVQEITIGSGMAITGTTLGLSSIGGMPVSRRVAYFNDPDASDGVLNNVGFRNVTSSGNIGPANDNTSMYAIYRTGAVAGNSAFVNSGAFCRAEHGPTFLFKFKTGASVANMRFWCGLATNAFPRADTLSGGAIKGIAFRYSTVAGDTGFVGYNGDGTTDSNTAQLGTVSASTSYTLVILATSGLVQFSVDGGSTFTSLSTHIPVSADMAVRFYIYTETAATREVQASIMYADAA